MVGVSYICICASKLRKKLNANKCFPIKNHTGTQLLTRDGSVGSVANGRRRYPQQAIAFSRSSYLAGINVAVAYRMVIYLLSLGEGWDVATFCSMFTTPPFIYIGHTAPKERNTKSLGIF